MAGTDRKATSLKILLLTLLLAVQALGHAHAIDHVVEGDNTLCSICSVSGHGSGAIVDSGDPASTGPQPHSVPPFIGREVPAAEALLPDARGPPLS